MIKPLAGRSVTNQTVADAQLFEMTPQLFKDTAQPFKREQFHPKADSIKQRAGKIKYGCLAWMIGLPLPIVILLMFYRGCDF